MYSFEFRKSAEASRVPWQYDKTCTGGNYHAWGFVQHLPNGKPVYKCSGCKKTDYPEGK